MKIFSIVNDGITTVYCADSIDDVINIASLINESLDIFGYEALKLDIDSLKSDTHTMIIKKINHLVDTLLTIRATDVLEKGTQFNIVLNSPNRKN